MPFELEALPACKGDALLLHFGTKAAPRLAVIDGGTSGVYEPSMKPRLIEIRAERGMPANQALPIDWMMVSHIDDDHIYGILELTRELTEAKDDDQALPYRIQDIWHNTFDDLLGTTPEDLQASITAGFGAASSAEIALDIAPQLTLDAAKILASVPQGRQLRDDIRKLELAHNEPFEDLVMLKPGAEPKVRFGGAAEGSIGVRVIGPMKDQLIALQKKHDQYLRALAKKRKKPVNRRSLEAALAAFSDKSAPNLSSIVTEVRSGEKLMLLTGDARGDFIIEGLKKAKLLSGGKSYVVDLLKVPHHGSDNNVTQEFFTAIQAMHYVFSGNGQHGNPERETMQMLFNARNADESLREETCTLWFNYPIEEIDRNRRLDWEKEFDKGRRTRHWDKAKDSLEAFFEGKAASVVKHELEGLDEPVRVVL